MARSVIDIKMSNTFHSALWTAQTSSNSYVCKARL